MVATALPVTSYRRTALSLTALVIVAQMMTSSSLALSANNLKSRQRFQQLMNSGVGPQSYGAHMKTATKRSSSSRGTCTCTCETRPVSASDTKSNSMPTSAALIRTAARKDASRGQHEAAVVDGKKPEKVTPATGTASEQPTDTTSDHQYVEAPSLDDVSESQSPASSELMQLLSSGQSSWGHGSRYPWKRLPDTMCFRHSCTSDSECCLRFNLCDRSAHVCVDCWYGSTCTSERDCCLRFPNCEREWETSPDGKKHVIGGKCVGEA